MEICTLHETDNHTGIPPLGFLQVRRPSCHPTNSVKAMKDKPTITAHTLLNLNKDTNIQKKKTKTKSYKFKNGFHSCAYHCAKQLYTSVLIIISLKQNWLQILFPVKATTSKQQKSKCHPQIQHTESSYHIYVSHWAVINVKAMLCHVLRIVDKILDIILYKSSLLASRMHHSSHVVSWRGQGSILGSGNSQYLDLLDIRPTFVISPQHQL